MSQANDGLSLERSVDGHYLRVGGELDAHTAPSLAAHVASDDTDVEQLDLSGVSFMDSSGLRVLIRATESATATGRPFRITGLAPSLRRVVEVAGLDGVLPIE